MFTKSKEDRIREQTLSVMAGANRVKKEIEAHPNADKLALALPNSGYRDDSVQRAAKAREQEQARLDSVVTEAQKQYDDYIKRSVNIAQQSRWGGTEKVDRGEGLMLQNALNTARQAAEAYKNETVIQNLAGVATGLSNNTAIRSEVDKQRAVQLGTKDTDQKRLFNFQTTEAQRQQKMGYSTWETEKYKAMTEDEAEIYNRLVKNGREKEAQDFLDALDSSLNYRVTKARTDAAAEVARDGFVNGLAASAGSVLLNMLGTGAQAEWAAVRAMRNNEAIDQYSEEMYGRNLSSTLRGTVSESIGNWAASLPVSEQGGTQSLAVQSGKFKAMPIEQQRESNRKIAEFLYNTGMSMADMVAMSPLGPAGMSIMMGTNSAADALIDAKNRGLSDGQAMALSVISGAAEVIAEKFSLEKLFDGKVSVSSLKAALVQGGVEASEEMATEIANTLADIFVAGDQSAYRTAVLAYMDQGMSYEQAESKAFVDVLEDIGKAGLGGFLSGGVMGGAVDVMNTNAQGRSVIDQTAQTFIKQGQTPEQAQQSATDYLKEELRAVGALADEGTVSYELSQRTGDMSTGDIGRAYLANKEAIDEGRVNLAKKQAAEEQTAEQETEAEPVISYTEAQAFRNEVDAEISEVQEQLAKARPKSTTAIELRKRLMSLRAERDSYSDIINDYATRETEAAQLRMGEIENELAQLNAELYEIPSTPKGTKRKPRIEARIKQLNDELDGLYEVVGEELYSAKEELYPAKEAETPDLSNSRLDIEETFIDAEIEKLQAEVQSVQAETDSIQNKNSKYAQKKQKRIDKLNNRIDGFIKRKAEIADIRAAKKEDAYAEPIIPEPDVVDTTPAVEPEQATAEMSQPASAQINDLRKQLEALPFKYSREGIKTQNQIKDLLAKLEKEMESKSPEVDANDVTDNIGGNEPVPDDVKNTLKNKKTQERKHEALKKRLNLDPAVISKIEALVNAGASIADAINVAPNVDPFAVTNYYKSYKQLNDTSDAATNYRKSVLNKRYEAIRNAIGDSLWRWKDKTTGLTYSRMTQERIIREIAQDDPEAAKWVEDNIFQPVHINEAAKNRWMTKYAERAEAHNMTENENKFVHILINERDLNQRLTEVNDRKGPKPEKAIKQMQEALDGVLRQKAELKSQDASLDEARCNKIADDFLGMYREIYEKLTGVQLKNGMPVTDFRSTYAPVVKDKKTGKDVLTYLGVELKTQDIPTSIAGLTEFYKPGKPWFSHDLRRTGYSTAYDMLGGLDEYLKSAGDVIFHTDDIQNVRMLENVIRESTTPEGRAETVKEWIDAGFTGDELAAKLEKEQVDNSHLSNYVRNLREYGNLLANKKSAFDRGFENLLGRGIYKTMQNVKGRITANVLGGNVSVLLSQLIPLTQATSVVSYKNLARGVAEAAAAYAKDDGFNNKSTFLTNRIGYKDVAFKDAVQKITDAVGKPFEIVDEVVSAAIVRGRYYDNLAKGMTERAAMQNADTIAAALIADRSKGALPTIFGSKNPLSTLITAFQVESNNQMDFIFKDLKMDVEQGAKKATGAAMALALTKMFVAAFMYDELRELVGLSGNALDPINMARDISEEVRKGIDEEQSISETAGNIIDTVTEQIPFVGGGRYGSIYENALPGLGKIADAVQTAEGMEQNAGRYVAQTALEELSKPVLYLGLPTGGAQLKKTVQGINALVQGESTKINKRGEEQTQYTVAPTLGNIVGGVLLGKSGLKENKEWKAAGFDSFSDKEQGVFRNLKDHGGDSAQFAEYREAYKTMRDADAEKNDALYARRDEILDGNPALTKAEALERAEMDLGYKIQNSTLKWAQQISRDTSLTDEQKADLLMLADFSASEIEDIKVLTDFGISATDYINVMSSLAELGLSIGDSSITSDVKKQLSQQIYEMNLTVDQKTALARRTIGDDWIVDYSDPYAHQLTILGKTAYNDWQEAKDEYGVSAKDYLNYRTTREKVEGEKDEDGKTIAYSKKAAVANYLEQFPETFRPVVAKYFQYEMDKLYKGIKLADGKWVID